MNFSSKVTRWIESNLCFKHVYPYSLQHKVANHCGVCCFELFKFENSPTYSCNKSNVIRSFVNSLQLLKFSTASAAFVPCTTFIIIYQPWRRRKRRHLNRKFGIGEKWVLMTYILKTEHGDVLFFPSLSTSKLFRKCFDSTFSLKSSQLKPLRWRRMKNTLSSKFPGIWKADK